VRRGAPCASGWAFQLQETQLADKLQVGEVLGLFRSFYRRSHTVDEVLALVELEEKRKARVVTLSGGQKAAARRRVRAREQARPVVSRRAHHRSRPAVAAPAVGDHSPLPRRGRHRAAHDALHGRAERLCDRVAIMDHGKVIAQGTPNELIASLGADHVVDFALTEGGIPDDLVEVLRQMGGVTAVRTGADGVSLTVVELHRALPALLALLHGARRGAVIADDASCLARRRLRRAHGTAAP
jgi:ABC-2 type transport system ATP-binding protein